MEARRTRPTTCSPRSSRSRDEGDALSHEELLDQVALLYVAGHETTVNLIGNGTLALLRHPDQLARVRDDPALVPNAVEELLRFDRPVQFSRRITLADLEIDDVTIPAGSFVFTVLGAANRDPAHFGPDADTLDLTRRDAPQHLSFGGGHPPLPRCGARAGRGARSRSVASSVASRASASQPTRRRGTADSCCVASTRCR